MSEQSFVACRHGPRRGFVERLADDLMAAVGHALDAESVSARRGLLQGLDPRCKLVALLSLILCVVLAKSLTLLAALFVLAVMLGALSGITPARLARQVWLGVLLFTGAIAIPAIVIVPGTPVWQLPWLHWTVTLQGLRSAAFLVGRAETAATFALLLVLSTPWMHVLKAMRALGVPVVVVAILGMTHRYIFVFLQTALQMFEARRSRIVAPLAGAQRRRMVMAAVGVLLAKTFQLSADVHLAMVSRGYRGEVHLLDDFRARNRDRLALLFALALPAAILWSQR
jgi:cobalt/nickel transport system permease protein